MKFKTKNPEVWAGTESAFTQYASDTARLQTEDSARLAQLDAKMELEAEGREFDSPLLTVQEGIGIITISGSLTNNNSPYALFFGMTPYAMISNAVVEAALDDRVKSIILDVDSPGGTVAGLASALAAIGEAQQLKPVSTHTSSTMASAGYWLGSAGGEVYADRLAEVGSIGVIAVLMEHTKELQDQGVTTTVIRAGEFKALGTPYEKHSEKVIQVTKERVDARYAQFLEDVAAHRGRTAESVRATMAEGQVFLAEQAMSVGLIDKVMSFSDTFRLVLGKTTKASNIDGSFSIRGVLASTADLPVIEEGGTMKNRVITPEAQAAAAEGVELDTALEIEAEATEVSANDLETTEEAEANAEESSETITTGEAEANAESKTVTTEGLSALVDKLSETSQLMAEANAKVSQLSADLLVAEAQTSKLKAIASESINRMHVAMGASSQDLDNVSADNVLLMYANTRATFLEKIPVGQTVEVSDTNPEVDQASEAMTNHLATLTTK